MSPNSDTSRGLADPAERRARNRAAQKKHRQKKQETDETRWHRIKHLEHVIERMSTVVVDFTDSLLRQDIVQENPALIATIQSAITDILVLANEAGDPIEGSKARKPRGRNIESNENFPRDREGERLGSVPDIVITATSNSPTTDSSQEAAIDPTDLAHNSPIHVALPALAEGAAVPLPLVPASCSQPSYQACPIPQELGPILCSSSQPPQSPNSFVFRLTHKCFDVGCLVLSRSTDSPIPLSEEYRMFGSTLRYRGRDEMILRMKWLLGPGTHELQALAELPWGGRWWDREFSGIELTTYATNATMVDSSAPEFLSVVGVEKQLVALGARLVEKGIIEMDSSKLPMLSGIHQEPTCAQPDSWSFVNLFPSRTSPPILDSPKVRVSVNALITNLCKIGVCLMKGPGFPKQALRRAIEESIITGDHGRTRQVRGTSWY